MEKNKVSIIIPVYNAEKFIGETIESVISQTYTTQIGRASCRERV